MKALAWVFILFLLLCSCGTIKKWNEEEKLDREAATKKNAEKWIELEKEYRPTIIGVLAEVTFFPANSFSSTESTKLRFSDGRIVFLRGLQPGIVFQLGSCNAITYDVTSSRIEKAMISEKCI